MKHIVCLGLICSFVLFFSSAIVAQGEAKDDYRSRADSLLQRINRLYTAKGHAGLYTETYPLNSENTVTYLAEGAPQKRNQEVSFLWPFSGMLSGCVSLYKQTGDPVYLKMLEEQILLGLETYWDETREPFCYQSYPRFNGDSDRFYDDNDWLAIDFCDLYLATKKKAYLDKAVALHDYIYSGWTDELGGGIYWCEQQRKSKHTCSNAPATVLCMKLYEATGDKKYLTQAKQTYDWTKKHLLDPADCVYWDNIKLDGSIAKEKYSYNTGQMIQAAVLLYNVTKEKYYIVDATQSAEGAIKHFTEVRKGITGHEKQFYTRSPWFNVILFRGLKSLAAITDDNSYIDVMADNANYVWMNSLNEYGLPGKDWAKPSEDVYTWLLDAACMIELYSELIETNNN